MERQHIEYEDFYEMLWGNISAKVVPPDFVASNEDFISGITFDLYRIYDLDESIQFRTIRKITEDIFYNLFRHSPTFNNEQNTDINSNI